MGFDVTKFFGNLNGPARARVVQAALRGVDLYGNHVIGKAQKRAPVETGSLKASGTAEEPQIEGTAIRQVIGFNVYYAAAVHEVLTAHHPVGEAKYLEKTMREEAPKLVPFIQKEIAKDL